MAIALTLDQVLDVYRLKTKTIRQHRCKSCWTTLALQATDKIERGGEGDFYIITGGMIVRGEFEPYYARSERWFGNQVMCPKCGIQGRLPGDKPYNWEAMKEQREAGNV